MEPRRHPHVVDVVAVTECELACFVPHAAGTDPAGHVARRLLATRDQLHRVEDLHVTRAATQVGTEVARGVAPFEGRALLVDEGLRPHHDPGRAEPALQRTGRREAARVEITFAVRQSFERRDLLAFGTRERHLARDHRLVVDEHRATAALPGGRATVLG